MKSFILPFLLLLPLSLLSSCKERSSAPAPMVESDAPVPTNRIDIPAPVRQNLGITFATVERRNVEQTLRVPGRFELLPSAHREYRAAAPGRVEFNIHQFDRVEPGTILYRIDSPRWRELQESIVSAESSLSQAKARSDSMVPLRAAHRTHEESLTAKVELWTQRIEQLKQLRDAGGGSAKDFAEAQGTLNAAQAELADIMEKDAELASRDLELQAELHAARARLELLLHTAASLTGLTVDELRAPVSRDGASSPRWLTINQLEIRAVDAGFVESISLTNGAIVDEHGLILSTVQPDQLRFRAKALQDDLRQLPDAARARIVPAAANQSDLSDSMEGSLVIGYTADPMLRTVDLVVIPESLQSWARSGVSGFIEIQLAGGREELAIPLACIVRDGSTPILFRRDPANPDKAIRLEADLGINDGRWVVVRSGVKAGDQIILEGVYPLLLATSGSIPKGGHFHSDGTFHEEAH